MKLRLYGWLGKGFWGMLLLFDYFLDSAAQESLKVDVLDVFHDTNLHLCTFEKHDWPVEQLWPLHLFFNDLQRLTNFNRNDTAPSDTAAAFQNIQLVRQQKNAKLSAEIVERCQEPPDQTIGPCKSTNTQGRQTRLASEILRSSWMFWLQEHKQHTSQHDRNGKQKGLRAIEKMNPCCGYRLILCKLNSQWKNSALGTWLLPLIHGWFQELKVHKCS